MADTTTTTLDHYAASYGTGKVHLGEMSRLPAHSVLYCTGRTVSGAFVVAEPVTCKACLKRARANGIDPEGEWS